MALLGSFTKQSREILDMDFDYNTTLAGRTDTIASQTSEVAPAGLTIVSTTRDVTNKKVKVVVSGGTNGNSYKVSVLATNTSGLVYEDEVNVIVEDV